MGAAGCVGRVGGLAVALGVGTAILAGAGVASAETDAPPTPSGPPATSPSADTGPGKPARPKLRLKLPRLTDLAGSVAASDDSPAPRVAARRSAVGKAVTDIAIPKNTVVANSVVRRAEATAAHWLSSPRVAAGRAPKPVGRMLGNRSTLTPRVATVASDSSGGAPERLSVAVANVVTDTLKPFLGAGPTAPPADSPAPWVLLAAARRELSTDQITYAPKVGVYQGVITGVNQAPDPALSSRNLPLTYTVVSTPSGGGKVDVDKTTGDFTYLPYSSGLNPDGSQQFATSEQFKVLVAETTPFDAALEGIPLVGDLVQPVLVRIHQVPILGDALAPLIGRSEVIPVTVGDAALAEGYRASIAFTTKIISFDGTPISVNFFPALGLAAGKTAPTILNGPSLATAGYTQPQQETTVFGLVPGLKQLRAGGYDVVTWDPRGEFASGGVLQLDSPDYEAKDVSAIITWVAGQPETALEDVPQGQPPDPLIGMVGGSYGGGIQLTSAGIDPRIDAIAPGIAWNSLNTALYPQHAFKTSFASLLLLSLVASGSRIDPTIYSGILTGALLGFLTPAQQDFLAAASPDNVVQNIDVPTLFLQGTVDVLFPLQQAVANATVIEKQQGVPVKMFWYCGGHGQCLDPVDQTKQTAVLAQATLAWMNTYVRDKGKTESDGVPNFQWVDQNGDLYSSAYLPTARSTLYSGSTPITASRTGHMILAVAPLLGGSGPQTQAKFPVSLATASKAVNAVNVEVQAPEGDANTYVVGAPTVTLTYSGVGTSRDLYAQLVDTQTGRVVGNILSPIPVVLDGKTRTVSVPMEDIAYTMEPGDTLTLQIVGTATPYEDFTSYGVVDITQVGVTLPTANPNYVTYEESLASDQAPAPSGGLLGI